MIYTVCSGTGTALLAIIGVWYFQESLNWIKVASISFIIIGVVGLNLSGTAHGAESGRLYPLHAK